MPRNVLLKFTICFESALIWPKKLAKRLTTSDQQPQTRHIPFAIRPSFVIRHSCFVIPASLVTQCAKSAMFAIRSPPKSANVICAEARTSMKLRSSKFIR
jgi:hypothetical protein